MFQPSAPGLLLPAVPSARTSPVLVISGVCGVRVVLGINLSQYSNLQLLYTGTNFKVRVLRQFFSEEGLQHLTCLNVLLSTGKKVILRPSYFVPGVH